MKLYPGMDVVKVRSRRVAQISGMDRDWVYLYWPDKDHQTRAPRKRVEGWASEWQPTPDHATLTWRPLRAD